MLKELIDQFYLENQKNREQTRFYITDAGKCPRAVFFKFKNAPKEPINPRLMRIFEHGENIHRNIFNILYRLRLGVVTEVPIPSQEIISGRADAILCMPAETGTGSENYVLDIKSINSMLFRKLAEPKIENVYQVQLYMHYFNIKKGMLLYVDKDQQEMKEFILDYDEPMCKGLLDKFYGLKTQVEQGIIPERLEDYPKNWQCMYCAFKDICKIKTTTKDWVQFKSELDLKSQIA